MSGQVIGAFLQVGYRWRARRNAIREWTFRRASLIWKQTCGEARVVVGPVVHVCACPWAKVCACPWANVCSNGHTAFDTPVYAEAA
jgi:hypothetical protein